MGIRSLSRAVPARGDAPTACVLGDLDLVRPLAMAGIRCALVAAPRSPARASRFVAEVLDGPADWARPGDALERLVSYGRAQAQPPLLYYQDDLHLLFVSRHREQLAGAFRFVIADPDLVEDLVDKARFAAVAQRLDLPVPATRVLSPAGLAPPADLVYPVMAKPLYRDHAVWRALSSDAKAVRIDTSEQLASLWPSLVAAGGDILAQTLVPGPETRIESYHSYVAEDGDVVAEFTGRKVRTYPVEYGRTTALTLTRERDVADTGRRVVRTLGLSGVSKVDFKRGPDGTLHLLEVNPRFTLWHHPAAVAGVNVPGLVYTDLVGAARPPVQPVRPGVRWCSEGDVVAARAWGIPLLRWLPWALRCETKHTWAWNDPAPFLRLLGGQLQGLLGAARRRGATGRARRGRRILQRSR